MILTNRAQKKLAQLGLDLNTIKTVIQKGEVVQQSARKTTSNGTGGQRLLTARELESQSVLKKIEGVHIRYKPDNNLIIDIYKR